MDPVLTGFSRQLQLLGISTVVANQTVDKVTDNALRICEAAGLAHIGAAVPWTPRCATRLLARGDICTVASDSTLTGTLTMISMFKQSKIRAQVCCMQTACRRHLMSNELWWA